MADRRKKGSGSVRERSDGRWEGRVIVGYDDNGKPIQKSVFAKTKTECNKKLKQLKDETVMVTGRLPSHAKASMKFGEWMDMWYQYYGKMGVSPTTQDSYKNYIYNHIIADIGDLQLDQLTQKHLQDYYERLKLGGRLVRQNVFGEGVSDRMVRGCHAICRKALEKACAVGLIPINPAIGCKIPPKKAREMEILTREEIQRFIIQAAYDGYYELFLLEFATGMRRGEICGLQWNDLNFSTGELSIRRQVVSVNDGVMVKKPKTKNSVRTVIIDTALLKVLYELKEKSESEWIFASPVKADSPLNPQTVYRKTQQILERAECKKVRFHDLRHTFATMSLENGMDIKTLSNMIGHSSVATTLDIYSHITDEMLKNASRVIDRGIGKEINRPENEIEIAMKQEVTPPTKTDFTAYKGKIRKSGTGGIYKLNDHLYEGRYTPTNAYGKRESCNVYGKTYEECEAKLEEMIARKRAEIAAEKARLKEQASA